MSAATENNAIAKDQDQVVNSVAATTSATESAAPVTKSNVGETSKDDKKKKTAAANLIPAPIPTSSPWKAVNVEIPVTQISIDEINSERKMNKSPALSIKSNTSTKWIPIKASITVANGNNSNNNNNKRSNNKKNQNRNKSSSNSNNASNNTMNNSRNKKKHNNTKKHVKGKQNENGEKDDEQTSTGNEEAQQSLTGDNSNGSAEQNQNNHRNQKKFQNNKHHHQHHHNGNGADGERKFHKNQNGFHQRSFNPNHRHSNNKYHHHHNNRFHQRPQQMAQLYSTLYPVQPSIMAVNNVARQMEYYLSDENLNNDSFLKEKFTKDGYVPVSLLAKFYRVVNMSFSGDLNIIMAALREIVFNENATVEIAKGEYTVKPKEEAKEESVTVESTEAEGEEPKETQENVASPLDNYFIRSKNWEQWINDSLTAEASIEQTLTGTALDDFLLKIITIQPPQLQQENQEPKQEKEETNTTEEPLSTTATTVEGETEAETEISA